MSSPFKHTRNTFVERRPYIVSNEKTNIMATHGWSVALTYGYITFLLTSVTIDQNHRRIKLWSMIQNQEVFRFVKYFTFICWFIIRAEANTLGLTTLTFLTQVSTQKIEDGHIVEAWNTEGPRDSTQFSKERTTTVPWLNSSVQGELTA